MVKMVESHSVNKIHSGHGFIGMDMEIAFYITLAVMKIQLSGRILNLNKFLKALGD